MLPQIWMAKFEILIPKNPKTIHNGGKHIKMIPAKKGKPKRKLPLTTK